MKIGTVTGSVWATRKANCLMGQTFLLIDTGTVASRYCMDAPIDAAVVAILDQEKA